jgi:predicted O-methyltransferase YrrM
MTPQERWTAVDQYLTDMLVPPDPVLDRALADSAAAGLPGIAVTPNQGKLLYLLAMIRSARDILEVGTLGGYSTLWLARALPARAAGTRPAGRVVTLEADPKHAAVARANFERAGLSDAIDLRLGPALDTLPQLAADAARDPAKQFDFVFIDADKSNTVAYFDWAVRLARPGALIVVDNVVRDGDVLDADSADASVRGIRRFMDDLANDARVTATAVQTVGSKGHDGFALAVVSDTVTTGHV